MYKLFIKDEIEWIKISSYLAMQNYLEPDYKSIWDNSARLYFELRRQGITICSNIDCAIAVMTLENNFTLYHDDQDFEVIAQHISLKQRKLNLQTNG